jgi:formylglycine-generating enzyme required for sulfatase activity
VLSAGHCRRTSPAARSHDRSLRLVAENENASEEGPQTAVTISRGFWMGKYEVTQGEYQAVMEGNPSYFNGDRTADGGTTAPISTVRWRA